MARPRNPSEWRIQAVLSGAKEIGPAAAEAVKGASLPPAQLLLVAQDSLNGTPKIAPHAIVNRSATIGHHTRVGAYATVGPGVTIAGKVDYKVTLAERIGPRARSRLFEMCKVIRMPLVEDFRLRKAPAW